MTTSKRVVAPFTNEFGDVINPGDDVVAVVTCTGQVSLRKAKYIGYIEREDWYPKKELKKYVQIEWLSQHSVCVYKGTTTPVNWSTYERGVTQTEYIPENKNKISTLQYNNILPVNASIDNFIKAV